MNNKTIVWVIALLILIAPALADYHYWDFEEGTGTHLEDRGGDPTDVDGTGTSNTWNCTSTPRFNISGGGEACSGGFDANTDKVEFPSDFTGNFTISLWVYGRAGDAVRTILSDAEAGYKGWYLMSGDDGDGIVKFFFMDGSGYSYSSNFSRLDMPASGWNHIVAVKNGTQTRIYLNGVLKDAGNLSAEMSPSTNTKTYLGYEGSNNAWQTFYDELKIYSWDVEETNISNLYNYGNIEGDESDQIYVAVYDEVTGTLITAVNTTASSGGETSNKNTGIHYLEGISGSGDVSVSELNSVDYKPRRYYNANWSGTHIFNAYLLNSSKSDVAQKTFTIQNTATQPIEGATINISRVVSGEWQIIMRANSDIVGQHSEYLDSTVQYYFTIEKEGYTTRTFYLYPTSTSYTILMYESAGILFNDTQGDITYQIIPYGSVLMANSTQIFNLTTSSDSGYLINFGIIYNSTVQDNVSSATGGSAVITLNTTPFDNETITIQYFMQTQGGFWSQNRTYYIYSAEYEGNQTFMGMFLNLKTEINPLYRFIIAIFLSLILGAGFFALLGAMGSSFIAWGAFLAFGIVGFIPIILPILAGILMILGYVFIGGNEGT